MSTNGTTTTATNFSVADDAAPQQLSLLATPSVPLQFRLDQRTRLSGLAHIAELRAQIAAQAANRPASRRRGERPAESTQIAA